MNPHKFIAAEGIVFCEYCGYASLKPCHQPGLPSMTWENNAPATEPCSLNPANSVKKKRAANDVSSLFNIDDVATFDSFFKLYPGRKRGALTEMTDLCKKHKDWSSVLPRLESAVKDQIASREAIPKGTFRPEWKNMKTWLNQRCWEESPMFVAPKTAFIEPPHPANYYSIKEYEEACMRMGLTPLSGEELERQLKGREDSPAESMGPL